VKRVLVLLALVVAPIAVWAQAAERRAQNLGPFDAIEIEGLADVRFTQGTVDQVVVEGDDAAQRAATFEVRGTLLSVRPSGAWKFWSNKRMQIHITARELKRVTIAGAADFTAALPVVAGKLAIQISGAGQAHFEQLKADELRFGISGAGEGQVSGSVSELNVNISGRGNFRGEKLMAQTAKVAVSGVGDAKLWVTQALNLSISGIGTVDYWGAPTVRRSVSGIGTVNDRGPKPAMER
jgi:Putative auto-transporter adhesin, head GIN domain